MSKGEFPNDKPPAYDSCPAYPQQNSQVYTQPPYQNYPAQTAYPQQPAYPQQTIQPPVVSPNHVVIQPGLGLQGRQVIVTSGASAVNNTVVIQSQPGLASLAHARNSPYPVAGVCPNCQQSITTRVEYSVGNYTWVAAGILSLFGLCLCAFIPCCMDSCKDVQHYCPVCNKYHGIYQRLKI